MKCQICGAQLTKPGDICNNCMNELLEDKKYKNDDEVVYELKKINQAFMLKMLLL